jgi:hypothetical protein
MVSLRLAAPAMAAGSVGHFPYVEVPDRYFGDAAAFLGGAWPDGAQPCR